MHNRTVKQFLFCVQFLWEIFVRTVIAHKQLTRIAHNPNHKHSNTEKSELGQGLLNPLMYSCFLEGFQTIQLDNGISVKVDLSANQKRKSSPAFAERSTVVTSWYWERNQYNKRH